MSKTKIGLCEGILSEGNVKSFRVPSVFKGYVLAKSNTHLKFETCIDEMKRGKASEMQRLGGLGAWASGPVKKNSMTNNLKESERSGGTYKW